MLAILVWAAGTAPLFADEGAGPPEEGKAGSGDPVVVRVNGEPIMASELERAVAERVPNLTGHGSLSAERLAFHRNAALRQLVVRRLELQEAAREGMTVTDADVNAEVARIRARFSDPEAYRAALAKAGLDAARVRAGTREHLLGSRLEERVMSQVKDPTTDQLRDYFKAHPDQFRIPPQATVSYILLPVDAAAPKEAWEAARARLAPWRDRVRGGEPFEKVKAEAAQDPGVRVKDEGRVHQGQGDVAEIDRAAFQLQAGQISDPVWTLFGYALVYVASTLPARDMAFDDLNLDLFKREWIEARRQEVLEDWVRDLVAKAQLEYGE